MSNTRIISCEVHDQLEVACLYRIEIEIHLEDGSSVAGTPITTETRGDKSEWLSLKSLDGTDWIPLGRIEKFAALTKNRFFDQVQVKTA
ncbi:MAG: Rho-binding antiterminator [Pseudomonadota bacterium]